MIDLNWLHFLILIFAVFSINYLIINEVTVYLSGKSYLSKWVLCFICSMVAVLFKNYVSSSFIYLLALAVVGGVEFINTLVGFMKKGKDHNYEKEEEHRKIPDINNEVLEYYQSQIAALKNRENEINGNPQNNNQVLTTNNINDKTGNTDGGPPSKINVSMKEIKIIDSDRMYGKQEFLKEIQGQKITLSPYLQSNLHNSKTVKK